MYMQKKLLAPLGNVLKYADIILSANCDELSVKKNLFHKALKIYPAMWKKPEAKDTIYISDACVKYAKPSAVKKIIDGLFEDDKFSENDLHEAFEKRLCDQFLGKHQ